MKTMDSALKCVFCFFVLISLFLSSSAQTCGNLSFPSSAPNRSFRTCRDLSQSSSYLHWTYDQSTGKLDVAYRHSGVSTGRWVAWAINPIGGAVAAMPGAQALVAIVASNGTAKAHTSSITGYATSLAEGDLIFPVSDLTVTYQGREVIIFATLYTSVSSVRHTWLHTWQEGALSGSTPKAHAMGHNLNFKETLNLVPGESHGESYEYMRCIFFSDPYVQTGRNNNTSL